MGLQGDLQSFALNDVLRLLAGTAKSGRLAVAADDRTGDLWLDSGQIVGGGVSSAPHATDLIDVVFELLRFPGGAFNFHDDEAADSPQPPVEVEAALASAEALLQEWAEVEAVVPSMDSWVVFAAEIDPAGTTVSAAQWKVLAALGGGLTVTELGDHFAQTDLAISRQVKDLVEAGLATLGDTPANRETPPPPAATPSPTTHADGDLSVLAADDGPVVIETSEEALLPEPLPSEGTSFGGELEDIDVTAVDGRDDDSGSAPATEADFDPEAEVAHGIEFGEPDPPAVVTDTDILTEDDDDLTAEVEETDEFDAADDFFGSSSGNEGEVSDDPLDSTPSTGAGAGSGGEDDDPDRGALLDFLSSVKP